MVIPLFPELKYPLYLFLLFLFLFTVKVLPSTFLISLMTISNLVFIQSTTIHLLLSRTSGQLCSHPIATQVPSTKLFMLFSRHVLLSLLPGHSSAQSHYIHTIFPSPLMTSPLNINGLLVLSFLSFLVYTLILYSVIKICISKMPSLF